jgi:hypothetical protein
MTRWPAGPKLFRAAHGYNHGGIDNPREGGKIDARVSKQSAAQVEDQGPVEARSEDVDGYTIDLMLFRQDIDSAPLLKGLPGDRYPCPHWGYVLKGRLTYRYADSEHVQFSPRDELSAVSTAIRTNMREMQGA